MRTITRGVFVALLLGALSSSCTPRPAQRSTSCADLTQQAINRNDAIRHVVGLMDIYLDDTSRNGLTEAEYQALGRQLMAEWAQSLRADLAKPPVTPTHEAWTADPYIDLEVTDQWTEVIAAYRRSRGRCGICREPVDLTVERGPRQPTIDHIVPRSKDGGSERTNLQLAHRVCNMRKGNR